MSNRIDVHHNLVPPFWQKALSMHGGDLSGWHSPVWSIDTSLALMDAQRIATAVPSLTAPSVTGWAAANFDLPRDVRAAINNGGAQQIFARLREAVAA